VLFTRCYEDDETKEYERREVCSTHGEVKNAKNVLFRNVKGRDQVRELDAYRRIILKWILK
jgi:hypothetical protein